MCLPLCVSPCFSASLREPPRLPRALPSRVVASSRDQKTAGPRITSGAGRKGDGRGWGWLSARFLHAANLRHSPRYDHARRRPSP